MSPIFLIQQSIYKFGDMRVEVDPAQEYLKFLVWFLYTFYMWGQWDELLM